MQLTECGLEGGALARPTVHLVFAPDDQDDDEVADGDDESWDDEEQKGQQGHVHLQQCHGFVLSAQSYQEQGLCPFVWDRTQPIRERGRKRERERERERDRARWRDTGTERQRYVQRECPQFQ